MLASVLRMVPASIASRSSSSSLSATILPFDLTSFTTDQQQSPWLPQPPSSQPQAPPTRPQAPPFSNDFVLYPSPVRQAARHRSIASTASQSNTLRSFPQQNLTFAQNPRRHSFQQPLQQTTQYHHLVSPVQDPRVTKVISQSQGYSAASPHIASPTGVRASPQHARLYAASVPSNSPQPSRPPVPLFHSTPDIINRTRQTQVHRRNMSTSNLPQGILAINLGVSIQDANSVIDFGDLFDFSTPSFGDDSSPANSTMCSPQVFTQAMFASVNDAASGAHTVSPKDLIMDSSAPPSASFTDMSTPSFESPGYFSHDTSPLFADADLAVGHEEWESLFPAEPSLSATVLDDAAIAAALSKAEPAPLPLARTASSPGQSPRTGRASTKHSSVSGVKPRNRDKPLPPIKYDVSDPVAVKRARNTEAARKSRARKAEHQEVLERRIADLEKSLEESQQREEYWKSVAEARQ
ncbi:hypothetical protein AJ80_08996 [Polytolypa hystricis UAMH7299]|uniref:BZIP domain-containing protein n=1 Tax=Polytolypa hystricis (strain UAMH7299) TaxID=1447883 RepID=A0A2B7WYG3_POLH7|nr:hypothetical protein AJ80_08996 [Polytolypa hystricis UAMH7299]